MTHSMKIPKQNLAFHEEARRAVSMEEINKSEELKHLLSKEIDRAYEIAMHRYKEKLELSIVKDFEGFYIELREKR